MMSMCAHMSAYMSTSEYVFVCICVPASGGRVDIPVFLLQKVDFAPAA